MTERIFSMTSGGAAAVRTLEAESSAIRRRETGMARLTTTEPMLRIAARMLMSLTPEEKVIACAGMHSGDPSGQFAMHLAVAISRLGHGSVLLVDADFRTHTITNLVQEPSEMGLADLLVSEQNDNAAIQSSDVDGLHLLPAGKGAVTPAILSSARMTFLIESFRRFAAVIFDVGPILEDSNSLLMASRADVIVATAATGERTKSDLNRFKSETKLLPSRLLGIVLTDVK